MRLENVQMEEELQHQDLDNTHRKQLQTCLILLCINISEAFPRFWNLMNQREAKDHLALMKSILHVMNEDEHTIQLAVGNENSPNDE
jgi:hypothetical protein